MFDRRHVTSLLPAAIMLFVAPAFAQDIWEPTQYLVPEEPNLCNSVGSSPIYRRPVIDGDRMAVQIIYWGDPPVYEMSGLLVFEQSEIGVWSQVDYIHLTDNGEDVTTSFDFSGDTLVYSVRGWDFSGPNQIFIYRENSEGTYDLSQVIENPSQAEESSFGQSVSMSGSCLLAGDHYWPGDGSERGAVYRWQRTGNTWNLAGTVQGGVNDRIGDEILAHEITPGYPMVAWITDKESSATQLLSVWHIEGDRWESQYVTDAQLGLHDFYELEGAGDALLVTGYVEGDWDNEITFAASIAADGGIWTPHVIEPKDDSYTYTRGFSGVGNELIARRDPPWEEPRGGDPTIYDRWILADAQEPTWAGDITVLNSATAWSDFAYSGDAILMDVGSIQIPDGDGGNCITRVMGHVSEPPPAPGACCVDTTCIPELSEVKCVASGGIWLGSGTACDQYTCANQGACCFEGICDTTYEADCGGVWYELKSCSKELCYEPPIPCPEDLSGDGQVGVDDLLMIIAAWGSCP